MNHSDFHNPPSVYNAHYEEQYDVQPSNLIQMSPGYDDIGLGAAYLEDVNLPFDQPVNSHNHSSVTLGDDMSRLGQNDPGIGRPINAVQGTNDSGCLWPKLLAHDIC
jgi:hypothetical protein